MLTYLHIGGLIAAGFDPSSSYLLTISHSGRGVFSTKTWERVAREYDETYRGYGEGIGPIEGQEIPVVEMDYDTETFEVISPDGRFRLACESSGIAVIAVSR